MKKYWQIFVTTIKEYFAYRLNFVLWRLRMFISLIVTFFLWVAVFQKNLSFANYDKTQLLSYILYANLVYNFVLGTRTVDVAAEINDGSIINTILKPVSLFRFYLVKDLADKLINIAFSLFEVFLVVYFFKVQLVVPKNLPIFLFFFVSGIFTSFFISLLLSFIGFWTTEVWAPRFIFLMMVYFLSGAYFPLDALPKPIYYLLLLTPFPYLFFLPTKVLLGKIDQTIFFQAVMSYVWLILSYVIAKQMWKKGNKNFSFWGR